MTPAPNIQKAHTCVIMSGLSPCVRFTLTSNVHVITVKNHTAHDKRTLRRIHTDTYTSTHINAHIHTHPHIHTSTHIHIHLCEQACLHTSASHARELYLLKCKTTRPNHNLSKVLHTIFVLGCLVRISHLVACFRVHGMCTC